MTKKQLEEINKEVASLLSELEVAANASGTYDEAENILNIQIDSPGAAVLIGFHGETLQAIQLILSFVAHKILGEWIRVLVNVGDYRQKREEQLNRLALNLAMKAKFSKEAQTIPNLSSAERRVVHLCLSDHPDVYTQSEGEGRNRQLIIKPKVTQ